MTVSFGAPNFLDVVERYVSNLDYPTPATSRPYGGGGSIGRRGLSEEELQDKIFEKSNEPKFSGKRSLDQKKEDEVDNYEGVLPSRIILGAMVVLVGLQQLAGLSIPFGVSAWKGSPNQRYQGDCFPLGSQHFTEVARLLQTAVPRSWRGEASDGYAEKISTLVTQAQTMARLDLEMQQLVKDHAGRISKTQMGIGIEQDILIAVYPVIRYLESDWRTFWVALTTARVTAVAAVGAAVGLLGWCLGTSIQTQQAVDRLGYGDVITALKPLFDAHQSAKVPAPQSQSRASVASGHAPVFPTMAGPSAIADTPTVTPSPGSASGSGPQRAPRHESTGAGQPSEVDAQQIAATPNPVPPSTPASPMPSAAQVRQPSGQAANPSGGVASPSERIIPHGAAEEAVRAGDGEETGADSGTEGAERAPIDVAAADREPAPTPAPSA
jgi:hypothetical protein